MRLRTAIAVLGVMVLASTADAKPKGEPEKKPKAAPMHCDEKGNNGVGNGLDPQPPGRPPMPPSPGLHRCAERPARPSLPRPFFPVRRRQLVHARTRPCSRRAVSAETAF